MPFLAAIIVSWITAVVGYLLNAKPIVPIAYGIINPGLMALFVLGARSHKGLRNLLSPSWYRLAGGILVIILLLNAPGSVYLHSLGIQYDRFLHFSAGFASLLLLTVLFAPLTLLGKTGRKIDKRAILTVVIAATFVGLFAWEGFQWGMDQLFGTDLFFDVKQDITRDAIEDILFGFGGMLLGTAYVVRSRSFWPTLTRSLEQQGSRVEGGPAKPERRD